MSSGQMVKQFVHLEASSSVGTCQATRAHELTSTQLRQAASASLETSSSAFLDQPKSANGSAAAGANAKLLLSSRFIEIPAYIIPSHVYVFRPNTKPSLLNRKRLLNEYRRSIWLEAEIVQFVCDHEPEPNVVDENPMFSVRFLVVQLRHHLRSPSPTFQIPYHVARPRDETLSLSTLFLKTKAVAEVQLDIADYTGWLKCIITEMSETSATVVPHPPNRRVKMATPIPNVSLAQLRPFAPADIKTFGDIGKLFRKRIPLSLQHQHAVEAHFRADETSAPLKALPSSAKELEQIYEVVLDLTAVTVELIATERGLSLFRELCLDPILNQEQKLITKKLKRFELLANRRKLYNYNCMIEFSVDKNHVGLIIGRRGHKLSHIAQTFRTELRILPINHGLRVARIYGLDATRVERAYTEVKFTYQEIAVIHVREIAAGR